LKKVISLLLIKKIKKLEMRHGYTLHFKMHIGARKFVLTFRFSRVYLTSAALAE
jgi:hypothetical protein